MSVTLLTYTYKGVKKYKKHFYGYFKRGGVRQKPVKLCEVKGKPPASLKMTDQGDLAYERSLAKARAMMDAHVESVSTDFDNANRLKQIVVLQTGKDDLKTKLSDLSELNKNRLRPKDLSESQIKFQKRVLDEFADFAAKRKVHFVFQVDEELADEYYKSIEHLALHSRRNRICTISGAVKRFGPYQERSPFAHALDVIKTSTRHTKQDQYEPFTNAQLKKILEFVRTDNTLRYLTTCCAYTGLRISDACTLRWWEVDLKAGILARRTIKTGEMVYPPIHPALRKELESNLVMYGDKEEYVCPEAAAIYSPEENRINVIGKKMIARALFGDTPDDAIPADSKPPTKEAVRMALEATKFLQSKKDRLYDVFCRHELGQSYREIERQTGHSRGQISGDIATIEDLMKVRLRPPQAKVPLYKLVEKTRTTGTTGIRKRSKYSWHSFRTTFVTALFLRGINEELIREWVGHTTIQMTRKYSRANKSHLIELFNETGGNRLIGLYGSDEPQKNSSSAQIARLLSALTPEQKSILAKQLQKSTSANLS